MDQIDALKQIAEEYPEFLSQAIQDIKDGIDLNELLSVLNSFY